MKQLLLLLSLVLAHTGHGQATRLWQLSTRGVAGATDSSDHVYTADWEQNPAGDISLTKHDALGTLLWQVVYDNTNAARFEAATWVETDHANNIIVSGTIRSGISSPVNAASLLMKFDAAGNLLWRRVFENDFDGSSTRKCLVDHDNNIYVLGLGSGPSGLVTKIKKFSPEGDALWSFFDSAGMGAGQNIKLTPDQHLLVVGRSTTGSLNGYAKIDLDGNVVWTRTGITSLTAGDLAGDSLGNSYLINGPYSVGATGGVLTKLGPSGSVIWAVTNSIVATKVEVGSDLNPVIGGFPGVNGFGVAFMKIDPSGNTIWINQDADGTSYNLLAHAMMKLDAANNAYLATGTMFDMAVCRVNADGTSAWVALSSGGYAYDFDFGTDCSLFVVGGGLARFAQPPSDVHCASMALEGTPGSIQLAIHAEQDGVYVLESSPNLQTWNPIEETNVTVAGAIEFSDSGSVQTGMYYRITRKPPASTP